LTASRDTTLNGVAQLRGDAELLWAEREVHRMARLMGFAPLRIDANYASGPWFLGTVPEGWIAGRFDLPGLQRPPCVAAGAGAGCLGVQLPAGSARRR
jgi:hypothetical protein